VSVENSHGKKVESSAGWHRSYAMGNFSVLFNILSDSKKKIKFLAKMRLLNHSMVKA
jgi:hypothetical protein